MKNRTLGIIPARGGSKGVKFKNKRHLAGKPLIVWTIEAALRARNVSEIVVTTDDQEIADIAIENGVRVVLRPNEISGDKSLVIDAIRHVVKSLDTSFDAFVLLQPTTPNRSFDDIDQIISLYYESGNKPVCSVVKVDDEHPSRMYNMTNDNVLAAMSPEMAAMRRQDVPPVYLRNGAAYVFGAKEVENGNIIPNEMHPFVMPADRSINIDCELDFALAEIIMGEKDAGTSGRNE